jgi:hypothetical protein
MVEVCFTDFPYLASTSRRGELKKSTLREIGVALKLTKASTNMNSTKLGQEQNHQHDAVYSFPDASLPRISAANSQPEVVEYEFVEVSGDEDEDEYEYEIVEEVVQKPKDPKRSGRRKVAIQHIETRNSRQMCYSKRKSGIMKKAHELATLTASQVLLVSVSETGHVYNYASPRFQPIVCTREGKELIHMCLKAISDDNTSSEVDKFKLMM